MPETSDELRIRLALEASEAIAQAGVFRESIEAIKEKMRELNESTKGSLKDITIGLIAAAKESEKIKISELGIDEDAIKAVKENTRDYIAFVRQAYQELNKEIATSKKEQAAKEKAELKALADAQKEYVQVTKQGYGTMSDAARQYGQYIQDLKDRIKEISSQTGGSFTQAAQQLAQSGTPIKDLNTAVRELRTETKATSESTKLFGIELGNLGSIGQFVFGSVLGLTAITVLRQIINFLKESVVSVIDFSQSIFKLSASVRGLQRQGLDITLGETAQKVEQLRKTFTFFSRAEIVEGIGQVQLLTRTLGFTKEQIDQMTDAVATLSVVMGKDFNETARSVALFLSSGYGEALQRVGIAEANRAAVAQEALALGINKSFMEMNEQERALAGLSILLRGVADLSGETALYQETLAGKVRELNAAWSDLQISLGEKVPLKETFVGGLIELIETTERKLDEFTIRWVLFISQIIAGYRAGAIAAKMFWESMQLRADFRPEAISQAYHEMVTAIRQDMLETAGVMYQPLLGEDVVAETKDNAEEITKIVEDMAKEIEKEYSRYKQKLADIESDLQYDLAKIDRDGAADREEIWIDYENRLIEIAIETENRIAEARARYALDVAQTIRQYNLRREELDRKYRERELKAEQDFQEKLRRLREGFLLDLEDALHERDARQVLRLIKQYNLQKDQATRQYEQEKGERDRQYREELRQLEEQRQERLRILAEELQARIDAINRSAQAEADAAKRAAEYKEEEQLREEERREEERKQRAEQLKKEAEQDAKDRLTQFTKELDELKKVSAEKGDEIVEALRQRFGKGGPFEALVNYVVALIGQLIARYQQIRGIAIAYGQGIKGTPTYKPKGSKQTESSPPEYQFGGEVRRGEIIWTGEEGPEPFIPAVNGRILSVKQSQEALAQAYAPGMAGRGEGMLKVLLSLSPDLVAEVIDQSLGQVSDVVFELDRRRR